MLQNIHKERNVRSMRKKNIIYKRENVYAIYYKETNTLYYNLNYAQSNIQVAPFYSYQNQFCHQG